MNINQDKPGFCSSTILVEAAAALPNVPPLHGGCIAAASRKFQIPVADWLDLSTGINPSAYPAPTIPPQYFSRLPEMEDAAFQAAVREYYRCRHFVAANGSQRFIELLPALRRPCNVLLPSVGYQEHAFHWARHGHCVFYYDGFQPQQIGAILASENIDVVVLIHPCNPTAATMQREVLLVWREQLAARDGWLVVDEAFIDLTPELSLAGASDFPGLIVLRSLGKFFGLAGLRVGFAMANEDTVRQLSLAVGPWPVAGPSQYTAAKALADRVWQEGCRIQLRESGEWMRSEMAVRFKGRIYQLMNAGLFVSIELAANDAESIYQGLARQGILVRHWPLPLQYGDRALLRFGLLGSDDSAGRERLQRALEKL